MSIENKILMLSLISKSSEQAWLGTTKLQKLSFLTELMLSEDNKRAFDYEFFMYDLGPISTQVYDDFEFLMNKELVVANEHGIRLSELGENIEEKFRDIIPKDISSAMNSIITEYASMKSDELVRMAHKTKIKLCDGTMTYIEDLARHFTLLPKPAKTIFRIGKNYAETFRILSDKSLTESLREARGKGTKSKKYEPLVLS